MLLDHIALIDVAPCNDDVHHYTRAIVDRHVLLVAWLGKPPPARCSHRAFRVRRAHDMRLALHVRWAAEQYAFGVSYKDVLDMAMDETVRTDIRPHQCRVDVQQITSH